MMASVLAALIGGANGQSSGRLYSGAPGGASTLIPSAQAHVSAGTVRPPIPVSGYPLRSFHSAAAPSPTLAPTVPPALPTPPPVREEPADRIAAFTAGYRDAGGPPQYLDHLIADVIPCESHWNPLNVSDAGHLGLLQFDPGTWETCARVGADWRDPYEQGWAGAILLNSIAEPGGTGGWRVCWW